MNIVFLLGNGFDLNCGLKSSYKDMYPGYVESESKSDNIKTFKETISSDISTWADFELAMAEYASEINDEKAILECLRDFKRYMRKYLDNEEKEFKKRIKLLLKNGNISAIRKELSDSLNNYYIDCGISNNYVKQISTMSYTGLNYYIVSYNYTETFEEILNAVNFHIQEIVHIHGKHSEADMAVGVDNLSQVTSKCKNNYAFQRAFVKPVYNDIINESRKTEAERIIQQSDVIIAFGLSLGETDLSWRQMIIDALKEEKYFILYNYEFFNRRGLFVDERMDVMDEAVDRLCEKWKVPLDEEYRSRIFIPIGKNIFKFGDIIASSLGSSETQGLNK